MVHKTWAGHIQEGSVEMVVAHILYGLYVDEKMNITIGGVQTYIKCLSDVLLELDIKPIVYQYSKSAFKTTIDNCEIVGVEGAKSSSDLLRFIDKTKPDYKNDILIFATDFLICKSFFTKTIAIQHGIAWDDTQDKQVNDVVNFFSIVKNALRSFIKYNRFKYCNHLVCVDYNFLNWYRTQVSHIDMECYIIPNFAKKLPHRILNDNKCISIVFARRLVQYRGTRLFAESIIPLMHKYKCLKVTIAGTGPDEEWLKDRFKNMDNIIFTSYDSVNSIEFHSHFDIAVVPTKASEGTSLSLLEAMSAGCAVVATNVGGMTNIILDGYNGFLVNPKQNELSDAIECLVLNSEERKRMAYRAMETVETSFSYQKWKKKWVNVIKNVQIKD